MTLPDHLIRVEELTDENDDSGISISDVSVPIVDVASATNTAADPSKEEQVHFFFNWFTKFTHIVNFA